MKFLGRLSASVREVCADEVKVNDRLAAGRFQAFSMSNVDSEGETVTEVTHLDGLVYIQGSGSPGYEFTLYPEETLMIEEEN